MVVAYVVEPACGTKTMAMVMVVLIAVLFWVEDVFGKDVEG